MDQFINKPRNFVSAIWMVNFAIGSIFLMTFYGGCKDDTIETLQSCNGSPDFCSHQYTRHTYPGTHNSFAFEPKFHSIVANQRRSISQQLEDGIRCLNLDVWLLTGNSYCIDSALYVYHSFPGFGCLFFTEILSEVKQFMDKNPNEVITITIEDTNANINQLNSAFSIANLNDYLYDKLPEKSWATLGQMIESKRRLVVFADVSNPNKIPGFFRNWNYIFDNPYEAESRNDFQCTVNRGNIGHDLFLLNHFITIINPRFDSAYVINSKASLLQHINDCKVSSNRLPNFIYNDFYEVGDIISVSDSLNRYVWP